jgi:glycosyltransferase involved in cell wall biosynthesis
VILLPLAIASCLCAAVPAVLFCCNLFAYRVPPAVSATTTLPPVSVLVPARNEEAGIAACLNSILNSTQIELEVIVMDDASDDRTAEIVTAYAARDNRVRLEHAPPLQPGWNGKQHACWRLADVARHDLFCFVDADVRLEPECLARMAANRQSTGVALVRGFPRQIVKTWMEWLLLPLIHFVLLGFLPIWRMRRNTLPAYAAGCGQFLMVTREAYITSGGHAGIRSSMHDGLMLPKLLRSHGLHTDLADLTPLATCRMYTNAHQVWQGLAKNATEGIATPARIVPITLLLLIGQVLPFLFAIGSLVRIAFELGGFGVDIHSHSWPPLLFLVGAAALAWLPRFLATWRFRQPLRSAILHPFGIFMLLAVQWYAFARKWNGGAVGWKQRSYSEQ